MNSNKNFFAVALIIIGILLIVQIFFDISILSTLNLGNLIGLLWPLFLFIPGLNMLRNKFNLGGLILTLVGGSFLLENLLELFNITFEGSRVFKFFWPVILIFIGYKLLTQNKKVEYDYDFSSISEDYDEENNASSTGIAFNSKKFVYFLDEMKPGITTLSLNISFGGAEIIVEEGIQVFLVGNYSLGGYEFFDVDGGGLHSSFKEVRYAEDDHAFDKTLIIKSNISFGGIEISSR